MKRYWMILTIAAGLAVASAQAQADEDHRAEMVALFGTVPSWIEAYPDVGQAALWEVLKSVWLEETALDAKTKELVALTVAAQIPCQYCVYWHRKGAQLAGASEQEIKEALAIGGLVREGSMIAQGADIDFDAYRAETDAIFRHIQAQAGD